MMTLKTFEKTNLATKTFYTVINNNGTYDSFFVDYFSEDFAQKLEKRNNLEKRNYKVKYIDYNSKGNFLSVTVEEPKKRS